MVPDRHPTRTELIEEYGITFIFAGAAENRPTALDDIFNRVKQLTKLEYNDWRDDAYRDPLQPWRQETKMRTDSIVENARSLRRLSHQSNEDDWRYTLEPRIFRRFEVEMNCRQCSNRLWRSHVEVPTDSKDLRSSKLARRQRNRVACTCDPYARDAAPRDGRNNLFESKIGPPLIYDPELLRELRKETEKPDRIIGLQCQGRIKKYLCSKDIRQASLGRTVRSQIRTSPVKTQDGSLDEKTLFPFLVCESKSASAPSAQPAIESQSAFEVRECLLIQHELEQVSDGRQQLGFEPLVWWLSHRGEEWNISAAYLTGTRNRHGRPKIDIEPLCRNVITFPDEALQLVLILDFICEWARDYYRDNIIDQLVRLAVTPSADYPQSPTPRSVVSHDLKDVDERSDGSEWTHRTEQVAALAANLDISGVFPQNHGSCQRGGGQTPGAALLESPQNIKSWRDGVASPVNERHATEAKDELRRFDKAECAFRDARYIRSNVMGLVINEDNVELLVNSQDTDAQSRHLFGRILTRLKQEKTILLRGETLLAMDAAWAGVNSRQPASVDESDTFHVMITFSAYFNHQWEQVRELCYLAVSKKVIKTLCWLANKEIKSRIVERTLGTETETIMGIIEIFLGTNIKANLTACLYRCSLSPAFDRGNNVENIFKDNNRLNPCSLAPNCNPKSRDLVWTIYKHHRVGRTEPSTPYLRLASRVDTQITPDTGSAWTGRPWTTLVILDPLLLVYNKNPQTLPSYAEQCIFFPDIRQRNKLTRDICLGGYQLSHSYKTYRLGPHSGWVLKYWNQTLVKDASSRHRNLKKYMQYLSDASLGDEGGVMVASNSAGNSTFFEADGPSTDVQSDYYDESSALSEFSDRSDSEYRAEGDSSDEGSCYVDEGGSSSESSDGYDSEGTVGNKSRDEELDQI